MQRKSNGFSGDYSSQCPVCLNTRLATPYRFSEFSVLRCESCESSWRSNMYSRNKLEEIYCGDDYERHPYFDRDRADEVRSNNQRLVNYRIGLERIESHVGHGRLLDVGSGSGTVLSMAKKRGWQCVGVEMSPGLGKATSIELEVPIHIGTFEDADLAPHSFQALTFWDVIEHVVDPVLCIRRTQDLLAPGGIALFCTPDEQSLLARTGQVLYRLGYHYPALALHPPNHTYFFCRDGFKRLLQGHGFEVVALYSQEAFFEHSPLASRLQKTGIGAIEALASIADRQYEMVVIARAVG